MWILKTLAFFMILIVLSFTPHFFNTKQKRALNSLRAESENARMLYTGKTRAVYDPLDEAYKVTDELKELVKKESTLDFSHYKVWPVISVWVDPKDLHDPGRGIFANPFKRGRLWERAAHISYYEGGERRFSSYAGVRIHGDFHRVDANKSLKFYFKKSYGEEHFPGDLGLGINGPHPIKRLLVRRDTEYHFINDMSHSMVRQMGGLAPYIKHVAVYLNGVLYHYMAMSELVYETSTAPYFGHDNFVFYKLRGNNDTKSHLLFENLMDRVKNDPRRMTLERMDALFNLDHVMANALTIAYTGNTDWAQGVWLKDLEKKNSKWLLSSWDFDYAFAKKFNHNTMNKIAQHWEVDVFKVILERQKTTLQHRLFNRLFKESEAFNDYFLTRVDMMFEEQLTPDFFAAKLMEYEKLANDAPENKLLRESVDLMKEFIAHRKPIFCADVLRVTGREAKTCKK